MHPDDLKYFYSSCLYAETPDFLYLKGDCEFNVTITNTWLTINADHALPVLILPENIGKVYQKSIQDLLELWKAWSCDYRVISAGLCFEIWLCRHCKSNFLGQVAWEFIRKFFDKVNVKRLWKEFLNEFNSDKHFCVEVELESDGKTSLKQNSKYLEPVCNK